MGQVFKCVPNKREPVVRFGPVEVRLCAMERFAHFKCRRLLVRLVGVAEDVAAEAEPLLVSQYQLDSGLQWPTPDEAVPPTPSPIHIQTSTPLVPELSIAPSEPCNRDSEGLHRLQTEHEFLLTLAEFVLHLRAETVGELKQTYRLPPGGPEPASVLVHDIGGRGRVAIFVAANELLTLSKTSNTISVYSLIRCVFINIILFPIISYYNLLYVLVCMYIYTSILKNLYHVFINIQAPFLEPNWSLFDIRRLFGDLQVDGRVADEWWPLFVE